MKLHPSSAGRWFNCPGSEKLIESLPQELRAAASDNEAAQRGTALHEVAERVLYGAQVDRAADALGIQLTDDERATIDLYRQECDPDWWDDRGIEDRVSGEIGGVHMSGIVDFWGLNRCDRRLKIVDLKTGRMEVEAHKNLQMMIYAYLLYQRMRAYVGEVETCIVQGNRVRRWSFNVSELDYFSKRLVEAVSNVQKGEPLAPGPYCRFCPASIICPAAYEAAVKAAESEFAETVAINPDEVSEKLRMIYDVILPFVNSFREAAARFLGTHNVIGWRLVRRHRMVWKSETKPSSILRFLRSRGVPVNDIAGVLSPAQAVKLAGEIPEKLVEKVESGASIRPDKYDTFDEIEEGE